MTNWVPVLERRRAARPLGRLAAAIGALGLTLGLGGCTNNDMTDLQRYVESVLARQGGRIEELPPIRPYTAYVYQGSEIDPFAPFYDDEPEQQQQTASSGPQPDLDRNREELEQYALDSLRMMGTLERDGATWAIVRSPDSLIHRISVGNYIGKNHGKIINISEDRIALKEIIPDGQGGWTEREAALALLE